MGGKAGSDGVDPFSVVSPHADGSHVESVKAMRGRMPFALRVLTGVCAFVLGFFINIAGVSVEMTC